MDSEEEGISSGQTIISVVRGLHGSTIDFQIKLLGALSVGDVRTGTIPSLLPSQKHYLKVYICGQTGYSDQYSKTNSGESLHFDRPWVRRPMCQGGRQSRCRRLPNRRMQSTPRDGVRFFWKASDGATDAQPVRQA
ncbi:MAG: hypothetical protein V1736_12880 [Pseudomonadota bacterium]